jgi:hypothetical protein
MTGDAESMGGIFTPIFNFADPGCVTWSAFVIETLLVEPVFERQHQVTHFKLDNFRSRFLGFCENRDGHYQQRQ